MPLQRKPSYEKQRQMIEREEDIKFPKQFFQSTQQKQQHIHRQQKLQNIAQRQQGNSLKRQNSSQSNKDKKPHFFHSELIRLILALILAIIIYDQSSSSSISYTEIIENQKMFLVKDIRGVFPPLNGSVLDLTNKKWKVVHLQNYVEADYEKFNNWTLQFDYLFMKEEDLSSEQNQEGISKSGISQKSDEQFNGIYGAYPLEVEERRQCLIGKQFIWKNYSYNMNIEETQGQQHQPYKLTAFTSDSSSDSKVSGDSQGQINTPQQQQSPAQDPSSSSSDQKTPSTQSIVLTPQCSSQLEQIGKLLQHISIWTISNEYLYLLMQNVISDDEDFLMILTEDREVTTQGLYFNAKLSQKSQNDQQRQKV